MSGVASTLAKKRALAAGFGTNANAVRYLNQDFSALRAQCLSSGTLFCDSTFPAGPEALGFNELGQSSHKTRGVTWKRPTVRAAGPGLGPGPDSGPAALDYVEGGGGGSVGRYLGLCCSALMEKHTNLRKTTTNMHK